MAELIAVSIVDEDGKSVRANPVLLRPEPPMTCEDVTSEIRAGGLGEGYLLDNNGITVRRAQQVPAGNYSYRVTGAAQQLAAPAGGVTEVLQAINELRVTNEQAINELRSGLQVLVLSQLPRYQPPKGHSRASSSGTSGNLLRDNDFKNKLLNDYGYPEKKCMVLGTDVELERCAIVGGHVWPVSHAAQGIDLLSDGASSNINHNRNGILWAEPFERAYTAGALAIGVDDHGQHTLVVLCRNWASAFLWDNFGKEAQQSLKGTKAEEWLRQKRFKDLQGRVLDFSGAKARDLRPWKRACLAWGRYSHHAIARNATLEPSAQDLLHLLSLDRISDYGAKQHLMSWLDHLPVPDHLLEPQLAVTPPAEPVQPSPARHVPATSSLVSSNSSNASQKQQAPGSRMFRSALKGLVNPTPVPK